MEVKKNYYRNINIYDFANPSSNIIKKNIEEMDQKYITHCKNINISEKLNCKIYKQQLKKNNNKHFINNR